MPNWKQLTEAFLVVVVLVLLLMFRADIRQQIADFICYAEGCDYRPLETFSMSTGAFNEENAMLHRGPFDHPDYIVPTFSREMHPQQ